MAELVGRQSCESFSRFLCSCTPPDHSYYCSLLATRRPTTGVVANGWTPGNQKFPYPSRATTIRVFYRGARPRQPDKAIEWHVLIGADICCRSKARTSPKAGASLKLVLGEARWGWWSSPRVGNKCGRRCLHRGTFQNSSAGADFIL